MTSPTNSASAEPFVHSAGYTAAAKQLLSKLVNSNEEVERIAQFVLRQASVQQVKAPEKEVLLKEVAQLPTLSEANNQMTQVVCDVLMEGKLTQQDVEQVATFFESDAGEKFAAAFPQIQTMQQLKELSIAYSMVNKLPPAEANQAEGEKAPALTDLSDDSSS